MTFPKIEEVQATVKSIQDARKAEREKEWQEKLQEKLPPMRAAVAALISEAAAEGGFFTAFRTDDGWPDDSVLKVLQRELIDAGYQTSLYRGRLEISWNAPEPDKLLIKLDLGGQFRGKEQEIRALLQDCIALDKPDQPDLTPNGKPLLAALWKALC